MTSLKKMVLGAAVAVGALAVSAVPANAAEFRAFVSAPVAYVPPCPGAGYVWVAPYRVGGYWYPGRWDFRGVRGPVVVGGFHGRGFDRGFYHDRFRR
jgi:hypothetical protein